MRRVSVFLIALVATLVGLLLCGAARADRSERRDAYLAAAAASIPTGREDETLSPYFFVLSDDPHLDRLPLERTEVDIEVAAAIAEVDVTQVYRNDGERTLEAIYVFPMSTRAAVHSMRMTVGDRVIEADVRERAKAREEYEEARDEGKTASLLEQQRPNVMQMNLANIRPGDEIKVELSYTEILVPEEKTYELVFPTVVGPRYSNTPRGSAGARDAFVETPYLHAGQPDPAGLEIRAFVHGGVPLASVTSPSHRIAVTYPDPGDAEIALEPGEERKRRDFILRYRLAGDAIETGLLLSLGDHESYFLLALEPPARTEAADVLRREYVFIVDVSGSMSGFPLDTSKALLKRLLKGLDRDDAFNVLLFAGGSDVLSESSLPATAGNVARALRFIDEQQGGGGTELLPALKRAYALPRFPATSRTVVVATDGYVGVEDEVFTLTRKRLGDANLFAFGIGAGVNRELIESLARAGDGEPFVVTKPAEAAAASKRFARYVSSPLLAGIEARFDGVDAYDLEPERAPDLFAERPIVIAGKIRGRLAGRVTITGITPEGPWSRVIDLAKARKIPAGDAARLYWARARIRLLGDRYRASQDADLEAEITALGIEHHLLTEFTSFVAVDKVVRGDGRTVTVKQPLPMPDGVSDLAVGDSFGHGGLGISGTGKGGGGTGYGSIGLGSLGTIGHGAGSGSGAGYGRGGNRYGVRAAAPQIRAGAAVVTGSLSKEVIRRIVRRHINEVRFCYEQQLQSDPSLGGRVVIRFVIDSKGNVTAAEVAESTFNDTIIETCILAAVRRWKFPAPEGGGGVVVNYPFELMP
ncbi:MAG: TonB family protein [Proteobacteria bacterium]|jgi:Ca-activated chloride channel family protein|nr:TonB family protein [Pseudomonadota bacterium]